MQQQSATREIRGRAATAHAKIAISPEHDTFQIDTHPEGYFAVYSRPGANFETFSADAVTND
jgi:hypothetical protein